MRQQAHGHSYGAGNIERRNFIQGPEGGCPLLTAVVNHLGAFKRAAVDLHTVFRGAHIRVFCSDRAAVRPETFRQSNRGPQCPAASLPASC